MYEPIFRAFMQRHPLPRGQRLPTFEEMVESAWNGIKNRVSKACNYDRGVEKGNAGYSGAEKSAERTENTAYLMVLSRSKT